MGRTARALAGAYGRVRGALAGRGGRGGGGRHAGHGARGERAGQARHARRTAAPPGGHGVHGAHARAGGVWGGARGPLGVLAVLGVLVLCALGGGALTGGGTPEAERRGQVPPIRVMPADGARGVRTGGPVRVTVPEGRLERVRVLRKGEARGRPLPGRFSADGRTWRQAGGRPLALSSAYTVDAVALDGAGRRSARHTTFTTSVPPHRFIGFFSPEDGQTVGTGIIVSLRFNRPISERAAVERAVRVTASPPVPVAAHWFGSSRLDFRPRTYWRPGTRVTLALRLRDVKGAPGAYGVQHKRVHFLIGRDQRSVVHARQHTMTVWRAGRPVAHVPVTSGAARTPTYSGTMVISEKYDVTRMDASTVGFGGEYDIADVPHAMRLTDSGTFLHGNYWAPERVFGRENVSHGCIGLRDVRGGSAASPAGSFYGGSLVGDPVTVVESPERTVAPDNGLGGWNMSWRDWLAGSALR